MQWLSMEAHSTRQQFKPFFDCSEVCNQAAVWPADVLADELVRTTLPSAWEPLVLKEQSTFLIAGRLS